jgi:hypothetical protein
MTCKSRIEEDLTKINFAEFVKESKGNFIRQNEMELNCENLKE